MLKFTLEQNPKIAAEIEMAIRTKAGLISKKLKETQRLKKNIIQKNQKKN